MGYSVGSGHVLGVHIPLRSQDNAALRYVTGRAAQTRTQPLSASTVTAGKSTQTLTRTQPPSASTVTAGKATRTLTRTCTPAVLSVATWATCETATHFRGCRGKEQELH